MKILHLDLKPVGDKYAEFRYFWDNPNHCQSRQLPLREITDLIQKIETEYYTRLHEKYAKTGQALYNWLDGSDRLLQGAINQHRREGIVLAIAATEKLAHLPWEVLHDGRKFLVESTPAIIPIRWVSNGKPIEYADSPQNRPLNVLFMATSPLGVEPELDYEAEEGQILQATNRTPVDLTVEESGCLTELGYVKREYETGHFDVFHLTGHATHKGGKSYFLTEDEYGNQVDSRTAEIADALFPLPPLIFLSGCRTGYATGGVVPSMAEELLNMGATAVLGWGERVRDTDATAAASKLYWELSQGGTVTKALCSTYQILIKQQARDWHKLRLYVADTLPQSLVTPLRTRGRKQLPKPTTKIEFRDDEKRLRVASRENFVGRRRQLQNCLRTLKTDDEKVGVLIYGMGGWGKSSIASRLWDRFSEHERLLWWRQIDESKIIQKLSSKLIKPELREIRTALETTDDGLDVKLAYLFSQLAELGEKPFLLILDDFEWNLEPRSGRYILKPEVASILSALVEAIQSTGTNHRIIITCRYDFNNNLLESFYKQGLEALRKAELTKKLNRLEHFSSGKLPEDLRERALNLADGNPRLLEFLNNKILGRKDAEAKLTELEKSPEQWKDEIIWEELYQLIDKPLQQVLSYCLVCELMVPMVALEAVCDSLTNYQQQLQRGRELGLIEMSSEELSSNRIYRVSRILPRIIPNIKLPEAPEVYPLYQKAHEKLHQLWGNKENESEEKWQEIFRLKFANKENPERFRQGFSQMLSVQYNSSADSAYESELRKVKEDLVADGLCKPLENYLKMQQWKEADEETAWIFYQVMVKENYQNWDDLLRDFPCETLKEINQLWLENSNGKFGISIQMKIYQSLGGTAEYNQEVWENFCDRVGWKQGKNWLTTTEVMNQFRDLVQGTQDASSVVVSRAFLPVLIYARVPVGFRRTWVPVQWRLGALIRTIGLFCRADTCNH